MAAAVICRSKSPGPATALWRDSVVTGGYSNSKVAGVSSGSSSSSAGRLPFVLVSVDSEAEKVLLARWAARWLVRWTHRLQAAAKAVERALELTRGALHRLAAAQERVPLALAPERGGVVCRAWVLLVVL
jgi:hypothetical protein